MDLNKSIEFLYKSVIDTSLNDEMDCDFEQMTDATTLIRGHNKRQIPMHRGSTRPCKKISSVVEKLATTTSTRATFILPILSTRSTNSGTAFGCPESCS
jgi:hypothetical protein